MATDRNSPPLPSPTNRAQRRGSLAGQFVDIFGARSANAGGGGVGRQNPAIAGPVTSAAFQAQQRRLSLTTVGLSGSPNAANPFEAMRPRTGSVSSSASGTVDESPFEDGDVAPTSVPTSPFARRLSFGARAMRDMRGSTATGTANGTSSAPLATSSPTAPNSRSLSVICHLPTCLGLCSPTSLPHSLHLILGSYADSLGVGYDFAEAMRHRAERTSVSAAPGPPPGLAHHRAKSVAIMEPPKEMPAPQPKRPDAFQERILKGDFYMD